MVIAMHIAEGFLPPVWAVIWTVIAAPFVVTGFRSLKHKLDERPEDKLLFAAAGAFAFVLSALKIPSVNGSCSHPTGVGMGAALFGASPMAALGSIVLVFQALLLAHGGVTTLGANIVSMAVVGPWVSWCVYRSLVNRLGFSTAGGVGATVGSLATYVVTALQLALAHPDASSGFGGSLVKFLGIFAVTQLPLAVIEGVVTALALRWLSAQSTIDIPTITGQTRERALAGRYLTAVLVSLAVLITAPVVARTGAEWAGADAQATDEIATVNPGYEPWMENWWSPPSGEIESFLFALQAALGAAVIGYVVGARRRRSTDTPPSSDLPVPSTPT